MVEEKTVEIIGKVNSVSNEALWTVAIEREADPGYAMQLYGLTDDEMGLLQMKIPSRLKITVTVTNL